MLRRITAQLVQEGKRRRGLKLTPGVLEGVIPARGHIIQRVFPKGRKDIIAVLLALENHLGQYWGTAIYLIKKDRKGNLHCREIKTNILGFLSDDVDADPYRRLRIVAVAARGNNIKVKYKES